MQKSMSISGIDTRSGFRKRSKSNSCCSGSMSVMPSAYETSDPAADPRPGPTGMSVLLGVADEVPDDQEVSGKLHLLNDAEFARQTLLVVGDRMLQLALLVQRSQRLQPAGEALARDVLEIAVDRVARRHLEIAETDC